MSNGAFDARAIASGAQELVKRSLAKTTLAGYVNYTMGYRPAKHHQYICHELDDVLKNVIIAENRAFGKSDEELELLDLPPGARIIMAAPPGHGKSIYTSHAFPGYAVARMPKGGSIVACSHTQDFADGWGRKVRNLCKSEEHSKIFPDAVLRSDDRAASRWSTTKGTNYQAAGVGSTITGLRASILLCDDLLKGIEDARNKKVREKIASWYFNDAKTRLKPGGSVIIIATRWDQDDLTGRLLDMMEDGTGEPWNYIRMPAICDDPENDPTHRELGTALWPGYIPLKHLEAVRDGGMNLAEWNSLYQQNPVPPEGGTTKRQWFQRYRWALLKQQDEVRKHSLLQEGLIFQSWDTAMAATDRSDPSVCVTVLFVPRTQEYYVLDVYSEVVDLPVLRLHAIELAKKVKSTFGRNDGIVIENKGTGSSLASFLKKDLPGFNLLLINPSKLGDKEFRWERAAPVIEAGRFHIPLDNENRRPLVSTKGDRAPGWIKPYVEELATFPSAKHDDQVDATGQLINWQEAKAMTRIRRRRLTIG